MTDDDPVNINIFKLLWSDLSSVCSEVVGRAILSCDLYVMIFFCEHHCDKMKVDWWDDNF